MTHIEQRVGTAAEWTLANPVLRKGEIGWESDTRKGKLGNGVTAWTGLSYLNTTPPVTSVAGRVGDIVLSLADIPGAAPLASPALTGNPTAPTPATADNDTSIATTAFVKAQAYAPLASPAFTGNPTGTTQSAGDNSTRLATTAYVKSQGYATLISPTFSGAVNAPTEAVAENSTRVATTAFVKSQGYAKTSDIGKFQSYSMVVSNVGVTGGSLVARYAMVGDLVKVRFRFSVTGAPTGSIFVSLPVLARTDFTPSGDNAIGTALTLHIGIGLYDGAVFQQSNSQAGFISTGGGAAWGGTTPAAWNNGDSISGVFEYEKA